MKSLTCIFVCALWFNTSGSAQTWNLAWSDEFNGTTLNPSNWTFETGGSGWGNNELEYYTSRAANTQISNGALQIIAKQESYGGRSYTSARLKTQNLRSFAYGKVEARIKLPVGQGLWPAFWMLGTNISQVGWPACGEIDIMEHVNTASVVNGTIHWDNNGHAQYGGTTPCNVTQYHVYSIFWNPDTIAWYVDGAKYWQGSIANNINGTEEFHAPFFILLNLAVGGNWPGNPDGTTPFPDTMFVDYVRVYQLTNGVREGAPGIPDHSELFRSYPNPFNPATHVKYQLAEELSVSLTLYDILGREIRTLVDETEHPGYYEVTVDGSELASGMYFTRLEAVDQSGRLKFSAVNKLVLTK